eukprot:5652696-Amphidinium_carterae.1
MAAETFNCGSVQRQWADLQVREAPTLPLPRNGHTSTILLPHCELQLSKDSCRRPDSFPITLAAHLGAENVRQKGICILCNLCGMDSSNLAG